MPDLMYFNGMLKSIYIKNFILIDELSLDFNNGLNVITGETGAGKSILINAIDVVLGGKCSKEVIKTGCDKALIELTIQTNNSQLSTLLEDNEIEISDDTEFVLSREITQSAVKYRLNGIIVSQGFVRELRTFILDIHSQHESYTFLQPKYHIKLLDSYMRTVCGDLIENYHNKYHEYTNLKSCFDNLKSKYDEISNQADFLSFQINEIGEANIISDSEDEELKKESSILENAEKLKELSASLHWNLSGEENSVLEILSKLKTNLSKAVSLDENLTEQEEKFNDAVELLHDISSELRNYSQNLDNDTERLNQIQERLFLLDKLKRKYGGSLEKVLETYDKLKEEYGLIENSTTELDKLESAIVQTEYDLKKMAKEISEARHNYAQVLSSLIVDNLVNLELPKCRFEISITEVPLGENGIDSVEFLISTNVSEPLKPLSKVASGGEISRVMLAIKSIFAQNDDIDTVIFDEIDTGISGKTSQSVADEISNLSKYRQIIMITHQAILAAKADRHIYVKKTQNDKTQVSIYVLDENDKLKALAELAAGDITDESLEFAKTLI